MTHIDNDKVDPQNHSDTQGINIDPGKVKADPEDSETPDRKQDKQDETVMDSQNRTSTGDLSQMDPGLGRQRPGSMTNMRFPSKDPKSDPEGPDLNSTSRGPAAPEVPGNGEVLKNPGDLKHDRGLEEDDINGNRRSIYFDAQGNKIVFDPWPGPGSGNVFIGVSGGGHQAGTGPGLTPAVEPDASLMAPRDPSNKRPTKAPSPKESFLTSVDISTTTTTMTTTTTTLHSEVAEGQQPPVLVAGSSGGPSSEDFSKVRIKGD